VSRTAFVNARLIDPAQDYDGPGGVLVEGETIAASGPDVTGAGLAPNDVVDCAGLAISPGLIDMRVFVGEPGAEHKETLETASRAAAAGGVTTMVVMPDTEPAIDDAALVDFVMRRARDTALVRVAPMAAITKGLAGREMTEIGLLRAAGAVAFTDGRRAVTDAGLMRRALAYARTYGALISAYAEEPALATGVMNESEVSARLGLAGSPAAAEIVMLLRDLELVRLTGGRYHASQITCRGALEAIGAAKREGLPVTCAASINHLALNENDIGDYRTFLRVEPPLRSEEDRAALADGLARGLIDVIVSSHDPQPPEDKRLPFAEATPGAAGVETLLSAALSLHHNEEAPLLRIIDAMTRAPADLLSLSGGRLTPGAPADLVVMDLSAPFVIRPQDLNSRSRNTPFEGRRMQGRAVRTLCGGRTVFTRDST